MSILGDVFKELFKMFVADLRLTLAILFGLLAVSLLHRAGFLDAGLSGLVLTLLCLGVLAETVLREARTRRGR